eukprot:TRINITY_DN4725_c0_g1_i1.p2 TRINITY_DN4725_c0_g1~~TRINITY_DN4725_c0_g1_i1.p2  ORF type:complete len:242 (-),score=38.38 TRINITY_DN4725_c0_g1_i1:71-715(-)
MTLLGFVQNAVFSGVTSGAADYICQRLEVRWARSRSRLAAAKILDLEGEDETEPFEPYDVPRTWRFTMCGVLQGLASYEFILLINGAIPGTSPSAVAEKALIDAYTPIGTLVCTLVMTTKLAGHDWHYVARKMRRDLLPAWGATVAFCAPTNIIKYAFVPVELQAMFGKLTGLLLGVGVSYFANRKLEAQPEPEPETSTVTKRRGVRGLCPKKH